MTTGNLKFVALAVIFGLVLVPVQSFALATGALSIANLNIAPQPIIAGSNITIAFNLYNSYQDSLEDVNLDLVGNYPILNYSPANTFIIGTMGIGLYGGGNNFKYTVNIPKNIQAGTYTVYVEASYQTILSSTENTTAESVMPITFYVSGNPNIVLTANPTNTIVPGQLSSMTLTALNVGTDNATNVSLTILQSKNFSATGATTYYAGTIVPKQSVNMLTTLQANSSLMQGTSTFPVQISYTTEYGKQVVKVVQVPVSVIISTPNIVPTIISANPPTLYSGSNQTITVALENIGTGVAKNVTVDFISTPNITVSSSASSAFVGAISPGQAVDESVVIIASKNANMSQYYLPVNLSYQTANYQTTINRTSKIKISLQKSAVFNVTGSSSSINPGNTYVPVTFTIKNTGNEVAQHITLSLQTIYPVAPVDSNQYVNQLAPGDSAQVTFYVNVDAQGNPGSYPVTIYEQWNQANGATSQQYVGSDDYFVQVGGTSNTGTSAGSSLLYPAIGVVIVVIIAVFVYRRMKSNSGKKKA